VNFLFNRFKDYLRRGGKRSFLIKVNILYTFIIKGLNIAIGFLLVPITLGYLNEYDYGIWITLSSIISWFAFFDIGLGHGLRNKLAEALAHKDIPTARIYISTTYAILILIGVAMLVIFRVVNPFLNWNLILNVEADYAQPLELIAWVVFVFFAARFVTQLIGTIYTAMQLPYRSDLLNLIGRVVSLGGIYALSRYANTSLLYLAVMFSFPLIVIFIIASLFFFIKHKHLAPGIRYVDFKHAGQLGGMGVKFFIIQISAIVLFQTSTIIIAQLFGPQEVTPYNIAYRLYNMAAMFFSILMTPFWTAFTDAYHKNDHSWIQHTIRKLQRLWILNAAFILVLTLVAGRVYAVWVGKIEVPPIYSWLFALHTISLTWITIYAYFLNGIGKIKMQYLISIGTALVNIPVSVFLGKLFGVKGILFAAIGFNLFNATWSTYQYRLIIQNKAQGIWNK